MVAAVVDEEIFGEGEELPQRRDVVSFAPDRDSEVECEDDEVGGENAVQTAAVEAPETGPCSALVGVEELRADEEAAQDEEEVDADPAEVGDGREHLRQGRLQMVEHDREDCCGSECVQAGESLGL